MKKLQNNFKFELTTLSPVAVTTGDTLSPVGDFFVSGKQFCLIDQEKFSKLLFDRNCLEHFRSGIYALRDDNKNGFFQNFFKKHLPGENIEDYVESKRKYTGKGNVTSAKKIIRNADKPYIPGSTLKGAIKTALFWDFLMQNPHELAMFIEYCLKKQRGDAFKEFSRIEEKIFGKLMNKDAPQPFSLLRLTDTGLLSDEQTEVLGTQRYHLLREDAKIPVSTEAIKRNVKTSFDISLHLSDKKTIPHLDFLFKENVDIKELLKKINAFSLASIEGELEVLSGKEHLANYRKIVRKLKRVIQDSEDGTTAYLRIGSGKTFFDNSVGLAILAYGKDGKEFQSFRELFFSKNAKGKYFPITRTLAEIETEEGKSALMPLGWIKISLLNQK